MKNVMLKLLEAQTTLLRDRENATEHPEVVEQLRATVPAPVLAHYLRLVAQGRKGVAVVRNGVCTQCHIRLPSSLAAVLVKEDDLHMCEQCGAFLILDPNAAPVAAPIEKPAPKALRVRRTARPLAA